MCKFCGEVFANKQKLGGHVSNVHPGQSSSYQQKRETFLARAGDRLILNEAKRIFYKLNPEGNHAKQHWKVTNYKREIRERLSGKPISEETVTEAGAIVLEGTYQQ